MQFFLSIILASFSVIGLAQDKTWSLDDCINHALENNIQVKQPILSLSSVKAIESKLPEAQFMSVHRSFIVNLDQIEVIERSRIVFGKEYIPVSDQYKEKFQEFSDKNFL